MPDENVTPGNGQGEPTGAPDNGQGFDFERSYNELRPQYTQATQRLSEYEGLFAALHDPDPAIQAEAAQILGLDFVEDTGAPSGGNDDDEWNDPLESKVAELEEVIQDLRQRSELEASAKEEQELIDLRDNYIGESIGAIEASLSGNGQRFQFSDKEEETLGNLAIAMADQDGIPDVQGAYERLFSAEGIIESRLQQRIESKRNAAIPPLGVTIPADKKPQTAAERRAYIDERWRQLNDQQ